MSAEVNDGVNAAADAIGARARSIAGVDHSGKPINIDVVHGSRERNRQRAMVVLAHKYASDLEGSRSILGRSAK